MICYPVPIARDNGYLTHFTLTLAQEQNQPPDESTGRRNAREHTDCRQCGRLLLFLGLFNRLGCSRFCLRWDRHFYTRSRGFLCFLPGQIDPGVTGNDPDFCRTLREIIGVAFACPGIIDADGESQPVVLLSQIPFYPYFAPAILSELESTCMRFDSLLFFIFATSS